MISLTVYDMLLPFQLICGLGQLRLQPPRSAQQAVVFLRWTNQLHADGQAGFANKQGQCSLQRASLSRPISQKYLTQLE
jgi:hypothetical protein